MLKEKPVLLYWQDLLLKSLYITFSLEQLLRVFSKLWLHITVLKQTVTQIQYHFLNDYLDLIW
jgi:hypothetical protein